MIARCCNDPDLKKNRKLLESLPGMAGVLSSAMLAHMGDVSRFSLNPMRQESGDWKGKSRISKRGNSATRKALYTPAIVAMKRGPAVVSLKKRLDAGKKTGKAVVCAAMKKLLRLAYGALKSGRPFDAEICLAR